MINEELVQRGYITETGLKGDMFGRFERFNLGSTRLDLLVTAGDLEIILPTQHRYSPVEYKAPKSPSALKLDDVLFHRVDGQLVPCVVQEHKGPTEFKARKGRNILAAQEQALLSADALGAPLAVATDGNNSYYIDVASSIDSGSINLLSEDRALNPGILASLLEGPKTAPKDPTPLAEKVWQLIWHATKAEPKDCLLTFVEFFVLKFLSDNLPSAVLPDDYSFYRLVGDEADFQRAKGKSEIEYYIHDIRPKIKSIFPDNTIVDDKTGVPQLFGLETLVSKTSIINGFVFLQSGDMSASSYNQVFRSVIREFEAFGPLNSIDPEFKLRLYETFLRRSARQQRLGQFFTPRNVVAPMLKMAQLKNLPDGAVVLDPAAGVGGFVLEPLMWAESLAGNLTLKAGQAKRRVKTIGIDVDSDLHILAKANMLLHIAEQVRNPATTPAALNKAMAETFVIMNENQTLGSLLNPPINSIDVIVTNPPYVTRGSAIYKETIKAVKGTKNGQDLKTYFDPAGLGLESLFLRYISGALKPGGRAFVIVPQGFLNRTEPGTKQLILDECNILASIQLPRNAFFNTAQKTYILALEKRHTKSDDRPEVLCGIARSTGETLDYRRTPQPEHNDLADIAAAFVARDNGEWDLADESDVCKVVPPSHFTAESRWDVVRFWDDQELITLGEKETPVDRVSFIEEATTTLNELLKDLDDARLELESVETSGTKTVRLDDAAAFTVRSGERITTSNIQLHPPLDEPDSVPVYSCFKEDWITKGSVSKAWLGTQTKKNKQRQPVPKYVIEEKPVVTVNANGASVGKVFIRPAGALLTDDVIAVHVASGVEINIDYFRHALQTAVTAGGYLYEAKLFATRVKELEIEVPINENGDFDLEQQKRVAHASHRFEEAVARLAEIGIDAGRADFI